MTNSILNFLIVGWTEQSVRADNGHYNCMSIMYDRVGWGAGEFSHAKIF